MLQCEAENYDDDNDENRHEDLYDGKINSLGDDPTSFRSLQIESQPPEPASQRKEDASF